MTARRCSVGPQNNPLFVSTMGAPSELKFLYVVHSSLDVIEERGACVRHLACAAAIAVEPSSQGTHGRAGGDALASTVATGSKSSDMYLGLLHSVENMRVYVCGRGAFGRRAPGPGWPLRDEATRSGTRITPWHPATATSPTRASSLWWC